MNRQSVDSPRPPNLNTMGVVDLSSTKLKVENQYLGLFAWLLQSIDIHPNRESRVYPIIQVEFLFVFYVEYPFLVKDGPSRWANEIIFCHLIL